MSINLRMFNQGKSRNLEMGYEARHNSIYSLCFIFSENIFTSGNISRAVGESIKGFNETKSYLKEFLKKNYRNGLGRLESIDIEGHLPEGYKKEIRRFLDRERIGYRPKN